MALLSAKSCLFATTWTEECQPSPSFTISQSLRFAQTHVHWVSDTIRPSHPLLSPSPPALNLSQHQGLFQCWLFASVSQNTGASTSASVLPMNIQDWVPLELTGLISVLPFFGIGMKTALFQSCGHCWVFQICWHVECSTLTASSFRIWNSSAEIPSPPLALFIVMLPKAHLVSHSRMSGPRLVTTPSWLSSSLRH